MLNIKILDYFYYAIPGSKPWKAIRTAKSVIIPMIAILGLCWSFVFLFLDTLDRNIDVVESVFIVYLSLFALPMAAFANVDTLALRFQSAIAIVDAFSLLVVAILLGIFGQGHVLYGISYFTLMYGAAYSFEALEIDFRLNTRARAHRHYVVRQGMYSLLIVIAVVFRVAIFLKQVTVSSDIVIAELPGAAGLFTLRDLWEFFVDVVILRVFYMAFSRLRQPADSIEIGRSYAVLDYPEP